MKKVFLYLQTIFLMLGGVIGAGFFSGRELVGFFGIDYFVVFLLVTFVIMLLCLILVFFVCRKCGGLDELNRALFSNYPFLKYSILFSSFICLSGMLAGLDAIWESFHFLPKLPILSIVTLLVLMLSSKFGIDGLKRLNLVLVPIMLCIIIALASGGRLTFFSGEVFNFSDGVVGVLRVVAYVFMNVFFILPLIIELSKEKSKKHLIISCVFTSLLLVVFAMLILGAVVGTGENAFNNPFPFLNTVNSEVGVLIYKLALFISIFTSSLSSFYPLYNHAKSKCKRGEWLLFITAFLASRSGFNVIIDYVFPLVSGVGGLFIVKCLLFLKKYKKQNKHNNIDRQDNKESYYEKEKR